MVLNIKHGQKDTKDESCKHPLDWTLATLEKTTWKETITQICIDTGTQDGKVYLTCQTPITALAMRMRRITIGSTKAVVVSSPSSNRANT